MQLTQMALQSSILPQRARFHRTYRFNRDKQLLEDNWEMREAVSLLGAGPTVPPSTKAALTA